MPVNLNQDRGAVGVFNSKFFIDKKHRTSFTSNSFPFPFSFSILIVSDCFSFILTSSNTYFVLIFFFLLNLVKYNFKINSPKKFVCYLLLNLPALVSYYFFELQWRYRKKNRVPKLNHVKLFNIPPEFKQYICPQFP